MKYLYEKNDIIFAECDDCGRILKFKKYQLEDIKTGVECFCGSVSSKITNMPELNKDPHDSNQSYAESMKTTQTSVPTPSDRASSGQASSTTGGFIPKCPTCGSTRIHKISLASKAIGGYMWGIFSSNVRNTFECTNCGYKW